MNKKDLIICVFFGFWAFIVRESLEIDSWTVQHIILLVGLGASFYLGLKANDK